MNAVLLVSRLRGAGGLTPSRAISMKSVIGASRPPSTLGGSRAVWVVSSLKLLPQKKQEALRSEMSFESESSKFDPDGRAGLRE